MGLEPTTPGLREESASKRIFGPSRFDLKIIHELYRDLYRWEDESYIDESLPLATRQSTFEIETKSISISFLRLLLQSSRGQPYYGQNSALMGKNGKSSHDSPWWETTYYGDQFFRRVNHKICGIDMYEPVCTAQRGGHLDGTWGVNCGQKTPKNFFSTFPVARAHVT